MDNNTYKINRADWIIATYEDAGCDPEVVRVDDSAGFLLLKFDPDEMKVVTVSNCDPEAWQEVLRELLDHWVKG